MSRVRSSAAFGRGWVFAIAGVCLAAATGCEPAGAPLERAFDARIAYRAERAATAGPFQPVLAAPAPAPPAVAATYDAVTGVTHSLMDRAGYLTPPDARVPVAIALDWIEANRAMLGLEAADLADIELTDSVYSQVTGATHLYWRQTVGGLPVLNAQLQVNVNREGRILSVNNGFVPSASLLVPSLTPRLDAADVVARAVRQIGLGHVDPVVVSRDAGVAQRTRLSSAGISAEPIEAQLMILPIDAGEARLVWSFAIHTLDGRHAFDFTADADTGAVWTRFDQIHEVASEYTVYPLPVASPLETRPLPPADGRSLVTAPEDGFASPLGWSASGQPFGNNVVAYHDRDGDNLPPDFRIDCNDAGATHCNFPIDLTRGPASYIGASVTNLFYWTNLIHDVQYLYGFDEAAGNFQFFANRAGAGGVGGDPVIAETQNDAKRLDCTAFAQVSSDGNPARLSFSMCSLATPRRDSSLDSTVVVHEYGHLVSIRQIGGPSQTLCLFHLQQAGEGISDWLAIAYTHQVDDAAGDPRAVGKYFAGQGPDGVGIRPAPYSTDFAINPFTFEDIGSGVSIPHGVGFVWATIAWEVYWELVALHGFDPNLHDALGGAGNQRMMLYMNEAMKNVGCVPTFADLRDAVLQAAVDNHAGEDLCPMWRAFARRGLGADATDDGPFSLTATNSFAVPPECSCTLAPVPDAADHGICAGDLVSIGPAPAPGNSYAWQPGGQMTREIAVAPAQTATYRVTASTPACGSASDETTVYVQTGPGGLVDDFESGAPGWTATSQWHLAEAAACGDRPPGESPTAFYYGRDDSCTYETGAASNAGVLTSPVVLGIDAASTLDFRYWRHVEDTPGTDFDRTEVEVVTTDGEIASTVFSLRSRDDSRGRWLDSGPISLADFAGRPARIRFRFQTVDGKRNAQPGWFIDDVTITGSGCEQD